MLFNLYYLYIGIGVKGWNNETMKQPFDTLRVTKTMNTNRKFWLTAIIYSISHLAIAQEITPEQFSRNPQLFYHSLSENENRGMPLSQGPLYNNEYSQLTRTDLSMPTVITDNIDGRESDPTVITDNVDGRENPSVITDNVDGRENPSVITDNVDGKENPTVITDNVDGKNSTPSSIPQNATGKNRTGNRSGESPEYERDFYSLKITNVITPNGDGYNDRFNLRFLSGFEPFMISIFNRWGEIVFRSSSASNSWEGSDMGYQVREGAYFYIISTAKGYRRSGLISVIR